MNSTTHPYLVPGGEDRRAVAVLLVGTADEFGYDQDEVRASQAGFRISERMAQVLRDDDAFNDLNVSRVAAAPVDDNSAEALAAEGSEAFTGQVPVAPFQRQATAHPVPDAQTDAGVPVGHPDYVGEPVLADDTESFVGEALADSDAEVFADLDDEAGPDVSYFDVDDTDDTDDEEPTDPPEDGFDVSEASVKDVKTFVEENPETLADVLAAEREGQNRSTLISWLTERQESSSTENKE